MNIKGISRKDILFLTISFFLVVVAWIGFNIYHIWATSTITQDLQKQIQPINDNFDTDMINTLKSRKQVVPIYTLTDQGSSSPEASLQEEQATTEATLGVDETLPNVEQ